MRIIFYIIAIILVLFGLSFALLNASIVKLNYYLGTVEIPLSLLLLLTVALGVVIGLIASLGPFFKLRRKNHQLRLRIKQLEHQIVTIKVPENPENKEQ
jgi:putative membrane protein